MSTVRLIADLHLGHTAMAHHRGFQDEFYHDEYLIETWNSTVKSKRDLTYILGDITMEKDFFYYQLDRLNGRKVVVGGNHDMSRDIRELLNYVEAFAGVIDYKGFVLTHIPIHPQELYERYRGNIHGHIHEHLIMNGDVPDSRYLNVSAEQIGYRPITIEELLIKYNRK